MLLSFSLLLDTFRFGQFIPFPSKTPSEKKKGKEEGMQKSKGYITAISHIQEMRNVFRVFLLMLAIAGVAMAVRSGKFCIASQFSRLFDIARILSISCEIRCWMLLMVNTAAHTICLIFWSSLCALLF